MFSPPKRSTREFLDTPGQNPDELRGLLSDIRRTNQRYGGYPLVLYYLDRFLPHLASGRMTLLDVATASADVPRAIAAWARRRHLRIQIAALDASPEILASARHGIDAYPEITLVRGDALALPVPDHAFDVVICSLALHHFADHQAVRVLQEIDRVARFGFIVNDILRSWSAYLGAWLDTRLLSRNRLARHDGPLSVLRSFTLHEFRRMIRDAGLPDVEVRTHPMFRAVLVRWPASAGTGERDTAVPR